MVSANAFAASEASCDLVDGIYRNSQENIEGIKFETLADIFTINNAKTLSFKLNNESFRFLRSDLDVDRQTKMTYISKKSNKTVRVVKLMLDRTPRDIAKTKEYYGNMVISGEMKESEIALGYYNKKNLVYNFYCRF